MALVFGNSGDQVTLPSNAGTDNLTTWSVLVWVRPTTLTNIRQIFTKLLSGVGHQIRLFGTSGDINISVDRATTDTTYTTSSTPLSAGTWACLLITFDANGSAGEVVNVYQGGLSTPLAEATYATTTDGSGSVANEATAPGRIGNQANGNAPFQGDIAIVARYNRVLTLAEGQMIQYNPQNLLSGCIGLYQLGYNGTGDQADLSGTGNTGVVTGATVIEHVPLRTFASPPSVQVTFGALDLTPPITARPKFADLTFGVHKKKRVIGLRTGMSMGFYPVPGAAGLTTKAVRPVAITKSRAELMLVIKKGRKGGLKVIGLVLRDGVVAAPGDLALEFKGMMTWIR